MTREGKQKTYKGPKLSMASMCLENESSPRCNTMLAGRMQKG